MPLTRSLKRLRRCVGRRNRNSIAYQAMKDQRIRKRVLSLMGKVVQKEMRQMCSLSASSILGKRDVHKLKDFNVSEIISEMEEHAPHTLTILRSCLGGRKKTKAQNLKRKGRTKTRIIEVDRVVAVCSAVLLRGRG